MKKIFLFLFMLSAGFSYAAAKDVTITVSNKSAIDRTNEIVEMPMKNVAAKMKISETASIIVLNAEGQQIPYQITYDGKLIFPVNVKAKSSAGYTIKTGTPEKFAIKACGKHYPERVDDIAWENDRIAFRTYGPALQASGERAFGYDVWVKSVPDLVVEKRYDGELNPETRALIKKVEAISPKAAKELSNAVSYHIDHGNGMDCYSVGPTLGAGASALMVDGKIIYPYCYKTFKILDNGPLRFTVEMVYNPLTIKGNNNVIETRILSLDAGTQLNKTIIKYENLKETTPIVTGLVIHEPEGVARIETNVEKGYITYADPTDNKNNNNGTIFVGAIVPKGVKDAKSIFFNETERKNERGGANGEVITVSDYTPGSEYTYYWGAGWSKFGFDSFADWNTYINNMAVKIKEPLKVSIK